MTLLNIFMIIVVIFVSLIVAAGMIVLAMMAIELFSDLLRGDNNANKGH